MLTTDHGLWRSVPLGYGDDVFVARLVGVEHEDAAPVVAALLRGGGDARRKQQQQQQHGDPHNSNSS